MPNAGSVLILRPVGIGTKQNTERGRMLGTSWYDVLMRYLGKLYTPIWRDQPNYYCDE